MTCRDNFHNRASGDPKSARLLFLLVSPHKPGVFPAAAGQCDGLRLNALSHSVVPEARLSGAAGFKVEIQSDNGDIGHDMQVGKARDLGLVQPGNMGLLCPGLDRGRMPPALWACRAPEDRRSGRREQGRRRSDLAVVRSNWRSRHCGTVNRRGSYRPS
jgi:hypothetical protein